MFVGPSEPTAIKGKFHEIHGVDGVTESRNKGGIGHRSVFICGATNKVKIPCMQPWASEGWSKFNELGKEGG